MGVGSRRSAFHSRQAIYNTQCRVRNPTYNWVESVAFVPDGKTLASGSDDKTVKLWDVGAGRELRTLSRHSDLVWSVAFAPDGKTLASGSEDGTIRLWGVLP